MALNMHSTVMDFLLQVHAITHHSLTCFSNKEVT